MASENMRRYSVLLVIRKIQIKITKMSIIKKKTDNDKCW